MEKFLVKVGEYKYMKSLYEEGEIYLRPIIDFCKMEETNGIGDEFENAIEVTCINNPLKCTFEFKEGNKAKIDTHPSFLEYRITDNDINGLIYSLSIVEFKQKNDVWNANIEHLQELGDNYNTTVIIFNVKKFVDRIIEKLKGYYSINNIYYGEILYYDEKNVIHKQITPFDKRKKYEYQHEFRFFVECDKKEPLSIKIGCLEDIADLYRMKCPIINII